MKILVTGANGFVGSALCACLEGKGQKIVRVVRKGQLRRDVTGVDIGPESDWLPHLGDVGCVIHLAGRVNVMRDKVADPLAECRRVNTAGTLRLACQAAEAGVRRFVFLSSVKVNGEETAVGYPFFETDTPAPEDSYGISKLEAEEGLRALAMKSGMEVVIIRPPLVYGPGVKANFLTMLRWLEKGVPLPLAAIRNRRSLIALDNLLDFIITCLDHPSAANQTFLVSDGENLATPEILRRMAAAMGRRAWLFPVHESLLRAGLKLSGKGDLARRLCGSLEVDISKADKLLGWLPPFSVDEALKGTAQAYLYEHKKSSIEGKAL